MSKRYCLIKKGRIVDPVSRINKIADVLIKDGIIDSIAGNIDFKDSSCDIVDADGCWVVPGLFDMHVHLREPGNEDKETIATGTAAALNGGFTGIACMPNTDPVIDNQEVVNFIRDRASVFPCSVYVIGSVTHGMQGATLSEIGKMKRAGAVALSEDGKSVASSQVMLNALRYASMEKLPVICHCEDPTFDHGSMHEGRVSSRLGIRGIPSVTEEIFIYRDLLLAEYADAPVHIAHVSTRRGVELIRQAKKRGIRVTCETAPHYLWFTEDDVGRYDTDFKMNPPLRTKSDQRALIQGLKDGTIDVIATDHAPHTIDDKDVPFDQGMNGVVGLETSAGAVITKLIGEKTIGPKRLVELMSVNPRKILNIEYPVIAGGRPAEFTLINPKMTWKVEIRNFQSKGKNSPFKNMELTGKVVGVFCKKSFFKNQQ
ncbi:MAG: dihydroorotase [Candidatus Omnitrophota bacterium]